MIKDIVVNLTTDAPRDVAADYAVTVARAFDAHLSGIAFAYDVFVPGSVFGEVPVDLAEVERGKREQAARATIARFDETARGGGVSAASHVLSATLADSADIFAGLARRFDLSVLAQSEPDTTARNMVVEAALFESGRPVLVVPYIQREGLELDCVMVCWDGSRSAARAVGDALPFLARAKKVEVVLVASEPGKSDEIPGADIAQHLARHGLKVELERIVAVDVDVTNTILSHAADVGGDLLVMGGYGHSRLREFVLGGVTRGILASMTLPTLMSH
jgi:nucleotide-binding universal stress UspA family protein